MSNQDNLYIHVYTGLSLPSISYRQPDEVCDTGLHLIDFIYADLSILAYDAMEEKKEQFLKELHPYFRHIASSAIKLFFENTKKKDSAQHYSYDGFILLQQQYKSWLQLYSEKGVCKELAELAGKYHFFSRSHYMSYNEDVVTDHFLLGFEDCLYLEFSEILRHKIRVKVCKNCQRLFIPQKSNVDYCTRIYADRKTCQDVGYSQTFARSVKNDELLQAYTRAYKAHYARMTKPRKRAENLSREDFEAWYMEAKEKLILARSGQLDAEEFKQWLKK